MLPLFIKLCLLFAIRHVARNFCTEPERRVCCCRCRCCCGVGCFFFCGGSNLKSDRAPRKTPRPRSRYLLAEGHEAPNGRPGARTGGLPPPGEGPSLGRLRRFPPAGGGAPGRVPGAGARSHRRSPAGGRPLGCGRADGCRSGGGPRGGCRAAAGGGRGSARGAGGVKGGSPKAPAGRAPSAGGSPRAVLEGRPSGFCP